MDLFKWISSVKRIIGNLSLIFPKLTIKRLQTMGHNGDVNYLTNR